MISLFFFSFVCLAVLVFLGLALIFLWLIAEKIITLVKIWWLIRKLNKEQKSYLRQLIKLQKILRNLTDLADISSRQMQCCPGLKDHSTQTTINGSNSKEIRSVEHQIETLAQHCRNIGISDEIVEKTIPPLL